MLSDLISSLCLRLNWKWMKTAIVHKTSSLVYPVLAALAGCSSTAGAETVHGLLKEE